MAEPIVEHDADCRSRHETLGPCDCTYPQRALIFAIAMQGIVSILDSRFERGRATP